MALVLADEGKAELLQMLLYNLSMTDSYYNMFLFVNNYTPTASMTISSFTKPTWSGYSDITLLRSQWQGFAVGSGIGSCVYGSTPRQWTVSGGSVTVYGYGIQSIVTSKMLWAEAFATPRVLAGPDILNVQPQFTDQTAP